MDTFFIENASSNVLEGSNNALCVGQTNSIGFVCTAKTALAPIIKQKWQKINFLTRIRKNYAKNVENDLYI